MTTGIVGAAVAAPGDGTDVDAKTNVVAALANRIAASDQKLADLSGDVSAKQQSVNRAVIDLQTADNAARAAAKALSVSDGAVTTADKKLTAAQKTFDSMVRAAYMQGNTGGGIADVLGGSDADAVIARQSVLTQVADKQRKALQSLRAAKSKAVGQRVAAKAAKVQADSARASAADRKAGAESAITEAVSALRTQQTAQQRLITQRTLAQQALDEAKKHAGDRAAQQQIYARYVVAEQQAQTVTPAAGAAGGSAPAAAGTAPNGVAGAGAPTADAGAGQAAGQIGQMAGTAVTGAKDFAKSIVDGAGSMFGFTAPQASSNGVGIIPPGLNTGAVPNVSSMSGAQMIETVVQRGMSVIGVQYAWGGGSPYGATKGIRDGGVADRYGDFDKLGFDCSGLMMYMYGAVGINLPHYTGYQYNIGQHVPLAQMKRGDMIFYGANASQHVAMYLGNNQMIEAPESGSAVKISPLRTSGAMPYVVRLINS
ncbi:NlpC/P60 family protein [Tsukamurella sp. 8F]|uniref:NlpC/P60 family protein n=1 Tax=unclassified Tsukamurella TaxID=2633480 RepID=UPI0023B9B021|nr:MULTISPECIES: NlpC/P60 family protein [unclassified Tsukamurella]MDF0529255.1 NlpC/P60 family protein [Tsukamurella sp. 8J]MDF0586908.1 NlpC/P60 family protein [Tsukamurella sp. 8F]